MIYYLKDGNKIEKGLFGWVSKIGNKIKDRMYRTITPRGYHIGQATKEFIKGDTRDMSKFTPLENEVWAQYLGTKYNGPSNLEPATYRPTKGGATYDDVVKLKDESLILSDNVLKLLLDNYKKTGKKSMLVKGNETGLGTYTISMGEDEKGKYISYYDDWDINPTRGISAKYNIPILNLVGDIVPGTHPFSVYGRRYYKNGGLIRKMLTASGGPIKLYDTLWADNWRDRLTSPVIVAKQLAELTSKIPIKYLGGNKDNARKEFWKQEPVLQHAVDSIASLYGINPESLKYRLDKEGFTDRLIKRVNMSVKHGTQSEHERGYKLLNNHNYNLAGTLMGLDDAKTYINSGKVKLINEKWFDLDKFQNEKGRITYPVEPVTLNDGIGIVAAHLKYFRDKALLDFPNASEYDLDRYANAYYNRGALGGKKWVLAGAKGYNYRKQGGKINAIEQYKQGSKIHIKKKNRGKFTAYCGGNVTSACIAKAKASGNPTLVKRATFAANARKWKHQEGGTFKRSNLSTGQQFAATFPFLYALGKAVDPTGISGYSDVKKADKEWGNNPSFSNGYNVAMEALGALPIISTGSRIWRALLGFVTGNGFIKDYKEASNLSDLYMNELVIDYFDNTVKPRREFEKHSQHVDYTDANHLPSPELAPKGSKAGLVINNYDYKYKDHYNYKKYVKHLKGGKLCLIPRN